MSTVQRPIIPNRVLDDAFHQAMMNTVGQDLAFAAVEAIWDVLFARCGVTTRWAGTLAGVSSLSEVLEIPLDGGA